MLTSSWFLEEYQKKPGQVESFVEHIRKGIELTASDPSAILIFSGQGGKGRSMRVGTRGVGIAGQGRGGDGEVLAARRPPASGLAKGAWGDALHCHVISSSPQAGQPGQPRGPSARAPPTT